VDVIRLVEPGVVAVCNPADASIRIAVEPTDARALFNAAHLFSSLSLLELLKRRDRFAVHAAAVASAGRAVLIAGPAGAGKTTLSVAAARAGWDFMGDDVALIRVAPGGGLTVIGFPDEIDLVPDAVRFFPELAPMFAGRGPGLAGKHALQPTAVGRVSWSASPALLVFPRIVAQGEPTFRRLSADEALLALVPNVIRTQPAATQRHLDALGHLARTCAAFDLQFSDPHSVPPVLRERLAAVADGC
jgi:hypothetical protein